MIKNRKELEQFHSELIGRESLSFKEALAIYEELHREAVLLGAISESNILDGIDVDIRIAKAINR